MVNALKIFTFRSAIFVKHFKLIKDTLLTSYGVQNIPDYNCDFIFSHLSLTELVLEVAKGAEIIVSYFATAHDAEEKVSCKL